MDSPSQLRHLLQGVQAGSAPSVERFVALYEPHIRRAVRRRLPHPMRTKYDSTDFVQMVWASTFRQRERFGEMTGHSEVLRFLTALARNKVVQELRKRLRTQGYNVNRERAFARDEDVAVPESVPSASQWAMARERWRNLTGHLPRRDRRVLWLRMQGATYVEIAKRLQLHERTVRKIVARLAP